MTVAEAEPADDLTPSPDVAAAPGRAGRAVAPVWLVAVAVVAGMLIRVWIMASPFGDVDSDEAVVGLMADQFLRGDLDTFFWGSNYGGTLDQLLTAGVFAVVGSSVSALKLVQVALAAMACVLTWRVGRRVVGEGAARAAALLFWVAPAAYLLFSTKSRGWHWTGVCLALGILLLCLRLVERPDRPSMAGLGLVLGLAFWTSPAIGFVAVPAVGWALVRRPGLLRTSWLGVVPFLIGVAPWLRYNLVNDFVSLDQPEAVDSTYVSRLTGFFADGLPMALGLKVPYSGAWLGGPLGPVAYGVALAAFVAVTVVAVRRPRWRGLVPLLVVAAAYPLLFAVPSSSFFVTEPRYLVFLAPVLALLLAHRLTTTGRLVGALAVAFGLSLVSLASLSSWADDNPTNYDLTAGDLAPVMSVLERRDVTAAWADYWTSYRLTFESDERVIVGSYDYVRHLPYQAEVAGRPSPAYVIHAGSRQDALLGPALTSGGTGYERIEAGRFVVYLPDRSVEPATFEAIWRA